MPGRERLQRQVRLRDGDEFLPGQNSCKGKGYVMLTKEECDAAKKQNEAEKKS